MFVIWLFVAAQLAALSVLSWRVWWSRYPCFMVMLSLDGLGAIVGAVDRPHAMSWWYYTWTPMEFAAMAATCAAVVEILFHRTACLDSSERFSCRFAGIMIAVGCVGFRWNITASTWYGWLVYAREYAFAGMALLMIWLTLFMIRRPVEDEPNGARRHCHILLALILANALIGPLPRQADRNRQKEYRQIAQKVFMIFTVGCCAAWIRFGDAIPEEADAQSLADHPSSPCRASYSRQRP